MKRSDRFNGQVTVTGTVHPSQKIIATWTAKVSWDASGYVVLMKDLGAPVTWSALPVGVPVFDRDGARVGVVEHVLADAGSGIFHGLIVRPAYLLDGAVFADRAQVDGLYEHGVTLTVVGAELHDPGGEDVENDGRGSD